MNASRVVNDSFRYLGNVLPAGIVLVKTELMQVA